MKNNTHISILIPAALLIVLSFIIQSKMIIANDVAYLTYTAKQLLHGAKYGEEIFESNPPMILYIYSPIHFLVDFLFIKIITAIRLYLFFLNIFSLSLCYYLLKKIIDKNKNFLFHAIFYMLLFVMFFLPCEEFGQREHILIMFMLPYVLSAVLSLDGKSINPILSGVIGILAGLGFALKPFFLAPLILIELYFIFVKKKLFGWVRIESIIIACILVIYLSSIFIYQPKYFIIILQTVSHYYFLGMKTPWLEILFSPSIFFCVFSFFTYFAFFEDKDLQIFSRVIWLALGGMICAFLVIPSNWYYHIFPALGLGCLLFIILLEKMFQSVTRESFHIKLILDYGILIILSCTIFFIPMVNCYLKTKYQILTERHDTLEKLVTYFNSFPGNHSVYCYSADSSRDCFPLVYYTNSQFAGRYPFFWWLQGLIKASENPSKKLSSNVINIEKKEIIDSLADDLNKLKTRWLIINLEDSRIRLGDTFNFIRYLSQNKKFQDAWKHYKYNKTIGNVEIYERTI